MIVFDISKNGKRICRAGRKNLVVLTAAVTYVVRKPTGRGRHAVQGTRKGSELDLHVGGMSELARGGSDHPRWASGSLAVGDEITIRVVRARTADRWVTHTRYTGAEIRRQQRAHYVQMKKKFERAGEASRHGLTPNRALQRPPARGRR